MRVFIDKEGKCSVCHLEIVEMEIMIRTALTLLVFEVFSDGGTDDIKFFVCIHL